MRRMRWAKRHIRSGPWMHRLRVMLGFDAERIDYHCREVPLNRLAMMWKSYLAEDAYEETGGGMGSAPPRFP